MKKTKATTNANVFLKPNDVIEDWVYLISQNLLKHDHLTIIVETNTNGKQNWKL